VLDIRLPEMSGLELQQELIGMKINLPTILITGHGDMQMAVAAMRLGAVDFIEMPFRVESNSSGSSLVVICCYLVLFDPAHEDCYVTVHDAFRSARRQLQDYARLKRNQVKNHNRDDKRQFRAKLSEDD
jgi:CheY-like chemotaxis protein